MSSNYKVVYIGMLKDGADTGQFIQDFMRLFNAPESHARRLMTLGRPLTLKDNVDQAMAEKYRAVLDKLGMQVRVEGMPGALSLASTMQIPQAPQPVAAPQNSEVAATKARCPKCGSERVKDDDCLACGVIISRYRERHPSVAAETPPARDLPHVMHQESEPGDSIDDTEVMSGPHGVPAGNGWQWIADGWGYFRRSPLPWIGAVVVWMLLIIGGSLIPLIGSLLVSLFAPVLAAGFMFGADEQREGGNFELRHLFAGFSNQMGPLVLVGLFYLIATVVVTVVAAMVFGGALATAGVSGNGDLQALMSLGGSMLLALLVLLLLLVPIMMAYWFAPALVALEGMSPFAAMKLSFMACMKNILPFLVYSLIALVLLMLASIPFGLGLLIMMPVMMAAMYTSYRDIFYAQTS